MNNKFLKKFSAITIATVMALGMTFTSYASTFTYKSATTNTDASKTVYVYCDGSACSTYSASISSRHLSAYTSTTGVLKYSGIEQVSLTYYYYDRSLSLTAVYSTTKIVNGTLEKTSATYIDSFNENIELLSMTSSHTVQGVYTQQLHTVCK